MDREVIEQKLESLRHCLRRIESKCPANAETLAIDADLQDIVSLNLSRAVQVHGIKRRASLFNTDRVVQRAAGRFST